MSTATYGGSLGGHFTLHLDAFEASVDTANNRSLVQVAVYMTADSTGTGVFNLSTTGGALNVNGNVFGTSMGGYDFRGSTGPYYLINGYQQWVNHAGDGTGSCYLEATHDAADSPYATTSGTSFTLGLTTINRYAAISSYTATNITDTAFTLNLSTDVTCSQFEYSLNNGSNWTTVVGAFTSTSVTVTNKASDTTFPTYVRVTRSDSGLTTTSSLLNVTTLKQNNFGVLADM